MSSTLQALAQLTFGNCQAHKINSQVRNGASMQTQKQHKSSRGHVHAVRTSCREIPGCESRLQLAMFCKPKEHARLLLDSLDPVEAGQGI